MITNKKIIRTLNNIIAQKKSKATADITKKDLEEFLNYLNNNDVFKQLKTSHKKLKDELQKEFKLTKETSSTLINYALHIDE